MKRQFSYADEEETIRECDYGRVEMSWKCHIKYPTLRRLKVSVISKTEPAKNNLLCNATLLKFQL